MKLYAMITLSVLVFAGCDEPKPKCYYPPIKKAKHISCEYFIKDDGSMDTNNSQIADKCLYMLANNQNYYEYSVDEYMKYVKDTDN